MWLMLLAAAFVLFARPAQPIRPVRPWPNRFSDSTIRFSFKKQARKTLIEIAKPEMTGL